MELARSIPGVDSVSMSYYGLFSGAQRNNEVSINSYSPQSEEERRIQDTFVTPGYFETMGIPILLGRAFKPEDREGSPRVAIVNQAFARHFFGDESPIGKRFGVDGEGSGNDVEIVGVARDLKYNDLREETPRYAYYPVFQQVTYLNSMELRTSRDPSKIAPMVRTAMAEVDKSLPILEVTTLTEQIRRSLRDDRMVSQLTGLSGLVALFLACLGLYGVMACSVAQRTGEIGVRLALGADRSQVVWMVLRDTLILVSAGILIGIPGALVVTRFASSLLFGLKPTDPLTMVTATLVLLLVAMLAGYMPAWQASRLDPASALRHE
jgi:predicted permease